MSGLIADYQKMVGEWAQRKGWDFTELDIPEKLCLVHSEISEALEEYRRKGSDIRQVYTKKNPERPGTEKPEGFGIELADAVIRILHLCAKFDLDLAALIERKMAYNEGRPYRHGDRNA